jgi:hypothetical protein
MKQPLIWLAVLAFGLLLIALTFTPVLDPPQCPDSAMQMPDGSHCIIGANMGLGLAASGPRAAASTSEGVAMSDANPSLEIDEGSSITATKMKKAADKIDVPTRDDQLLSPYRDDPDS